MCVCEDRARERERGGMREDDESHISKSVLARLPEVAVFVKEHIHTHNVLCVCVVHSCYSSLSIPESNMLPGHTVFFHTFPLVRFLGNT